jgi:hypothetical protein
MRHVRNDKYCSYWRTCQLLVCHLVLLSVTVMHAVGQPLNQPLPSPAQPLIQHKSLGAVQLRLETDRQTMGITDRLRLTLSVEAPASLVITFPQVADQLGPFTVLSQNPIGPLTTAPQTQQWKREYALEADRVGTLTIPPLTVSFLDTEATQKAPPQQLRTDPLTITVTTVLPDDADVTAPKDIAPPVVLSRHGMPPWVWIVIASLVSFGLFGGMWWWYRRRRPRAAALPPPQPAHVIALEALRRLQREDLIRRQRIEEFYVRLSDILRHYVEWRFGLRAPEQTTEEFLAVVLSTGGLIATHRDLLRTFLEHCDLVKFARHQPGPDDMQEALESARVFVEQTADEQAVVTVSSSGVEVL